MKLLIILSLAAIGASGQGLDLKHLDRLADKTDESVNITLDEGLIRLGSSFFPQSDPELRELKGILGGLKAIYVRSFQFQREGEYTTADVDRIYQQLKTPVWSQVVEIKERGGKERKTIFIKSDAGKLGGLVLVNTAPSELTVISIEGSITPEQLEKLGGRLGIPEIQIKRNSNKKNDDEEEL
jgi:hypothetical protein